MTLEEFLKVDLSGQRIVMSQLETTDSEEVVRRWNEVCSIDENGEEYLLVNVEFYDKLAKAINQE